MDQINNMYCNNCGKKGHGFYHCRLPIISNGIIAFRKNAETNNIEYLMIRRRHTLGFVDFIRGKYAVDNTYYIANMIYQMTNEEKEHLKTKEFDEIWASIWGDDSESHHKNERIISCEKFNQLRSANGLNNLIEASTTSWDEQEWGFPKGRKNYNETDLDCAIREFNEETGFEIDKRNIVQNISPFEETFCGSNYKSYKHKYFLMFVDFQQLKPFHNYEISDMRWMGYQECVLAIRPYNLEKKRMISNVDILLKRAILVSQS